MKKHISNSRAGVRVLVLLLVAMLPAACTSKPQDAGKELVIGVSQDYRATDVFSHKGFNCLVFQTLVKMDAAGKIQPLLAKSWEKSRDGKSYLFHLRKEALFSDGTPVTAQQVKASMLYKQTRKRKRGPARGAGRRPNTPPGRSAAARGKDDAQINREYGTFDNQRYNLPNWYAFQSIEVIDDHTLKFNLAAPYTLFLNELATTHMYPVLKADDSEPVTGYIGTGPYKIGEWKRTQYMTLVKNDHFWQGEVTLAAIRLKVIPDAETRAIALEAGEIHMTGYDHFDKIPNESVMRLKNLSSITVKQMAAVDHPSVSYVAINYKKAPFTHQNVRQAIALAIDRTSLDKVMTETGRTVKGPFPQDHVLYNPAIVPHRFDPEQARRLLAEAGWKDNDQDGILDKGGQRFSTTLCFNSFDPQYKTMAEIIQAQLKAVGIELKLQMMELGAHITTMRNATYDLALWPMMRYHMFFYTGRPSWLNVYNSPQLDDAFARYLHGADEQESREAIAQTQQLIMESHVFPVFIERFDVVAWNHNYLKNCDPQPLGWDLSMGLWKAEIESK
ncbi:MAG: ABC transporter substrate-binding protein [Desulfobacteraceae bacterium]|jgi:peptide/nickel transport system substrate-binding protein